MAPDEDSRLSELLATQQERGLSDDERAELLRLARIYDAALLRKAGALAEAVRRGLCAPLRA